MNDEQEIEYKIRVTPWYKWISDYGNWQYSDDTDYEYELSHDSIEGLYESIGRDYNKWVLRTEDKCRQGGGLRDEYKMENNGIKYSSIFVEVEPYSEEKRNATKAYKEIGEVRDAFIAVEKAKADAEKIRVAEWKKEEQDRRDRAEFERLQRKFGKTS